MRLEATILFNSIRWQTKLIGSDKQRGMKEKLLAHSIHGLIQSHTSSALSKYT
jgi:hypothetical protein